MYMCVSLPHKSLNKFQTTGGQSIEGKGRQPFFELGNQIYARLRHVYALEIRRVGIFDIWGLKTKIYHGPGTSSYQADYDKSVASGKFANS